MFKLKSTLVACLGLSAIGGSLVYGIRPAASRDADLRANPPVPTAATAQGTATALTEAGQTTTSPAVGDNLIAQAVRRRIVRSGTQSTPLAGIVQIAGSPVAGATVTLYAAGTGVLQNWPKATRV